MNYRLTLAVVLLLLTANSGMAQNKPIARVPFSMLGSYMVVKANINESRDLKFIFDTGIRSTIITEFEAGDS
ncbi:MAG: hypothetical protein PHE04_08280, partial [Bacteroidales bacterium]|nr:hypothetical protein [Bacteroidales bacterium]